MYIVHIVQHFAHMQAASSACAHVVSKYGCTRTAASVFACVCKTNTPQTQQIAPKAQVNATRRRFDLVFCRVSVTQTHRVSVFQCPAQHTRSWQTSSSARRHRQNSLETRADALRRCSSHRKLTESRRVDTQSIDAAEGVDVGYSSFVIRFASIHRCLNIDFVRTISV